MLNKNLRYSTTKPKQIYMCLRSDTDKTTTTEVDSPDAMQHRIKPLPISSIRRDNVLSMHLSISKTLYIYIIYIYNISIYILKKNVQMTSNFLAGVYLHMFEWVHNMLLDSLQFLMELAKAKNYKVKANHLLNIQKLEPRNWFSCPLIFWSKPIYI